MLNFKQRQPTPKIKRIQTRKKRDKCVSVVGNPRAMIDYKTRHEKREDIPPKSDQDRMERELF